MYRRQHLPSQDTLRGLQRNVDQLAAAVDTYSATLHSLAPAGAAGSGNSPGKAPGVAGGVGAKGPSSRPAQQGQHAAAAVDHREGDDLFMSPTWEGEGTPLRSAGDEAVQAARRERWQQRQASLGSSRRARSPPGRQLGRGEESHWQRRGAERDHERGPRRAAAVTATPGWQAARTAAAHVRRSGGRVGCLCMCTSLLAGK